MYNYNVKYRIFTKFNRFFILLQIVKLVEVTSMGSSIVLVMELLPWSLAEIIKNSSISLSLSQVKTYTKMILSGVNYMHQNHVMHRVCIIHIHTCNFFYHYKKF